jgi:hypothetical protein
VAHTDSSGASGSNDDPTKNTDNRGGGGDVGPQAGTGGSSGSSAGYGGEGGGVVMVGQAGVNAPYDPCPLAPPSDGTSCATGNLCLYPDLCGPFYACLSGVWRRQVPDPPCLPQCPLDPPQNGGACPPVGAFQNGILVDAGVPACSYACTPLRNAAFAVCAGGVWLVSYAGCGIEAAPVRDASMVLPEAN